MFSLSLSQHCASMILFFKNPRSFLNWRFQKLPIIITLLKSWVGLEIICGGYQSSCSVKPTFARMFLAEQTLLHHISIELNFDATIMKKERTHVSDHLKCPVQSKKKDWQGEYQPSCSQHHSSHISLSQEEIINLFYIQVNQSNLTTETHPLFLTS